MLKEQLNSTDIYPNRSLSSNFITLKIDSADPKWASLFLRDETADYQILHRQSYYPVHRNVIFKNISLHVLDNEFEEGVLTLPNHFNPSMVQGVISCLYSLELKICRSQALEVLDIIHCLHIPKLQRKLEQDIKNNIEDYEIFILLEKSLTMSMNQIEQMCLNQLQLDSYEQMCYEKYSLLQCNEQTFKYVIVHHNERRWEDHNFGQSQKAIQDLIQEYCRHHDYDQKDIQKMKYELKEVNMVCDQPSFTKNKLTPLKLNSRNHESPMEVKLYTPRSIVKEPLIHLNSLSPFEPNCSSTKSMIIDLTYMGEKKRKSSRGSDTYLDKKTSLCSALKEENKKMSEQAQSLMQRVKKMTKTLKQKQVESRNNKFKLGQIQGLLQECQTEMMEQNRTLMLLDVRTDKIQEKMLLKQLEQADETLYLSKVQSVTSQENYGQEKPKVQNEKDETLRVSIIQSRWVAV